MDRRSFIKIGGALAASTLFASGSHILLAAEDKNAASKTGRRWAMVVDLDKCTGCKTCETACREENNVPFFDEPRYDAYWLRVAAIKQHLPGTEERPVPLMCQHCDDPPCVHVCVTKASFVRKDGIVLVDEHRCIGCRYCVYACPYKARSIVFKEGERTNTEVPRMMVGVATKCNFCVHRVDKGQKPACVEKCPSNALIFGDMNDPHSEIAKIIAKDKVKTLRDELELGSGVFYKGL